jgi:outer membrane protein assembly factor BamD (BamD/ComL family)
MSNIKLIATNIAILIAGVLIWKIWSSWGTWDVPTKFVVFMLLCIVVGVPFVAYIMPQIGDRIGDFFYSAPAKVEEDAYSKAAATLSRGEYPEAVTAYKALSRDNPTDRFPVVEIAKIQIEKLHDVDGGLATLEAALQRGNWRENDEAFFIFRLAEIHQLQKNDIDRAREYLEMAKAQFPETRHYANAIHKLHELGKA